MSFGFDPSNVVPPMIIDVILDTSALPTNQVLMLKVGPDGRRVRADGRDLAADFKPWREGGNSPSGSSARAADAQISQKSIVLERWTLTFQ